MRGYLKSLIMFFIIFIAVGAGHADTPKRNIVFVFDASGSMDSPMGDKSKIAAAKEALSSIIGELPSDTNTGLISYGLHRQGDCNDVEELVPLGPTDKKNFVRKLETIKPKGMSAIFLSVRKAAERMKGLSGEGAIILMTDGQDNCQNDACRMIRELGTRHTLNIIGIDIRKEESAQLSCMANAGNGKYFSAQSGEELTRDLRKALESSGIRLSAVVKTPDKTPKSETRNPKPETQKKVVAESEKLIVTAKTGRIRKEPSLTSEVSHTLNKGDTVTVIETKGEWHQVRSANGKSGWGHLSIFGEAKNAPKTRIPEIREIKAVVTPEGDEKVVFVFDSLAVPKISVLKEAIPKLVCDFSEVRVAGTIGRTIKVNGHLLNNIRIGKQEAGSAKLRVVLDLFPDRQYASNQISSKEDNTHTVILTSVKRSN